MKEPAGNIGRALLRARRKSGGAETRWLNETSRDVGSPHATRIRQQFTPPTAAEANLSNPHKVYSLNILY